MKKIHKIVNFQDISTVKQKNLKKMSYFFGYFVEKVKHET